VFLLGCFFCCLFVNPVAHFFNGSSFFLFVGLGLPFVVLFVSGRFLCFLFFLCVDLWFCRISFVRSSGLLLFQVVLFAVRLGRLGRVWRGVPVRLAGARQHKDGRVRAQGGEGDGGIHGVLGFCFSFFVSPLFSP